MGIKLHTVLKFPEHFFFKGPHARQEKVASSTSATSTTIPSAPAATAATLETNVKKPRNILAGLKAFAERVNVAGVDGLRAAFTKLQQRGQHPPKMSIAVQARNKAKCRYFGKILEEILHSFMRIFLPKQLNRVEKLVKTQIFAPIVTTRAPFQRSIPC
uniref:Uncharacterized protein n=1 Tax=Parascaris equorum TaxID=6256 RepID=A0A914S6K0_PAREQ